MAIYLDHNATTPLAPEVLEAMLPYLTGPYANASSLHRLGRAARDAVEQARGEVAALVGARPQDVIWTSGGTEANNLALKGLLSPGVPARIAYGATEHPAVMEAAESLRTSGVDVVALPVDGDGLLQSEGLAHALRQPTLLVSLMRANNETGVLHDLATLAPQIHAAGALLHVDAVQAAGKLALDVTTLGADLLSLSSHKLYGPKGVGALVRVAPVDLQTQQHGGAQEGGLRGGTLNVPAIVGFGAACAQAQAQLESRMDHMLALRQRLEAGLRTCAGVRIFAEAAERLPNTVQFALPGWAGEALLMQLDRRGFCVSSGSACASGSGEPSHVLLAMGVDPDVAFGAVRASLGIGNTVDEIDAFIDALRALATP
ncbi:cysteine desulfurase [Flagellatimonas centrodinii]|uniref:cysteine desulfurase family protein n=1 Tax=Flagellatimonas centrodinii TaxID=2806210 RepID=UPI001FEF5A5E|nr:cysteine desulfurase family protein [Flagellatimonas centrodinii]ULQ46873.1 cysteine desulfurase [Flagellatimonas centrodinii]